MIRLVIAAVLSTALLSTSCTAWAKAVNSKGRLTRHLSRSHAHLSGTHHSRLQKITLHKRGATPESSRTEAALCTSETTPENIHNVLAPSPETLRAVREAVEAAPQLDPVLLLTIARAESRFDPEAKNRLSSARGLLQFTRDTWLEVMRQFGARHGFETYANEIRRDQSGGLSVERPATLRAILLLRDNPRLSAVMAAERLTQLSGPLEHELGRKPGAPDLYFMHVLGPSGAARFLAALRSHPQSSSLDVVGLSAPLNKGLFIRNSCTLSVAQAYDRIGAVLGAGDGQYRPMLANHTEQVSNGPEKVLETAQAPGLDFVLP